MAEKIKIPEIRFKGFSEEWEEKKLGKIAEFNPKAELPEIFEYVDLESVVGTEMIAHREERRHTAPSRAQRLARQGDLFYQTVRPYQKNNYLFEKNCENYVFSTGYAQMRPYGNSYFLLSLVQNDEFVKKVLDNCTGTSYPAINSNNLAELDVYSPTKNAEQSQIGTLFSHLDHLITLRQRKYNKLVTIKKAMLEKMFPQNGARVPEIRFKGFTEKWEEKKLGEVIESAYQGINTTADQVKYANNGVPILQAKHITSGKIEFSDVRYLNKESNINYFPKYTPQKGDLLFANIGTIGPSTITNTNDEFLIAWNILKLTMNILSDSQYIHLLFEQMKDNHFFESIQRGNATKFINKDSLMNIDILLPTKEEQEKIGNYFKNIDHLITLQQHELEKFKNIKKAYLEKMFV